MTYVFKLLNVAILIILGPMMIWTGCGQQQRTPRHADTALQTSFLDQLNGRTCHLTSNVILPDEDWQQKRGVSFECFLLLSLFLLIALPKCTNPALHLTLIHLPVKFMLVSIAKLSSYVTVIR